MRSVFRGQNGCKNEWLCPSSSPSPLPYMYIVRPGRSDGAERSADECSCLGANKKKWHTSSEGDDRDIPLPPADKSKGQSSLSTDMHKLFDCVYILFNRWRISIVSTLSTLRAPKEK